MSQKPQSTKLRKVAAKLADRQSFYDRVLKNWSGCNRPGGNPHDDGKAKVWFDSEQDALGRLKQLGFDVEASKKLIPLAGRMSLGICTAVDYLVNHCGYKFTRVVVESG